MEPFDSYRCGGYQLLGGWKGSNARHEYGLKFMKMTGQTHCAYCEQDLTEDFNLWLTLALDHAIPKSLCKEWGPQVAWCWDFSNAVLSCGPCNGFCNRYRPKFVVAPPKTPEEFFKRRDEIFEDRKKAIASRRAGENEYFKGKPWEKPLNEAHPDRRKPLVTCD
jgi:hypothetical protein